MYCPKCKESFEEGSRRFCPTDGARLVSERFDQAAPRSGGIFSNLVRKTEITRDLDDIFPDTAQFGQTDPDPVITIRENEANGDFFEFEEIELEIGPEPVIPTFVITDPEPLILEPEPEKPKVKRTARKIKPFEIPAGHGETDRERADVTSDASDDDPNSFVGKTVKGRYLMTEFLGGEEGSFAFLADDTLVKDRKVLVRILSAEEADDFASSVQDDELVSLSHISHPNIARVIDSGQYADGKRFLVSEYVDALSVTDILEIHGNFGGQRAARIIKQIAYALNEVHGEGIVHRDLRPENIIVTTDENNIEQAMLINFGASNGEPNDNNMGYKAPEVFDGKVSTIGGDIFSLAVVAYEMLTGSMPFDGPTRKALVRSQYAGMEQLPTDIQRVLPMSIDRVMERALAFSPADRYVKARDFGDAFYAALSETPPTISDAPDADHKHSSLESRSTAPRSETDGPAWKNRSPEPPQTDNPRAKWIAAVGISLLLILFAVGWYFIFKNPGPDLTSQIPGNSFPGNGQSLPSTEMPPLPRNVPQPPNTNFYQNSKQNLKGDLIRNFVGFSLYYPRDWKVNGSQESSVPNTRGKFLDIARLDPDGRPKEQMLISYYPSKGTFREDSDKFPQMVKETNDTLKKLLPSYQMVSEGEIKINGAWRAYEVKFQGSGPSEGGEKLFVWGRRLFIPASRPGVRNGFEITMLATSLADEVKNVDDVGVRGELASILYSFEPSQNF